MTFLTVGEPMTRSTWSALVSGNYFSTLAVRPQLGRLLTVADERETQSLPAVVISDHVWRGDFQGDPTAIGRRIRIGPTDFVIIGVAPPDFTGTHPEGRTDLWLPFTRQGEATGTAPTFNRRNSRRAMIIGRLAPGASLAELQTSLDVASQDLNDRSVAGQPKLRFRAKSHERLLDFRDSPEAVAMLALMWIMIALVTLVAESNISSLMLSRIAAARQDLGIRLCLGASRRRVVSYTLLEAFVLLIPGTLAGLMVTRWLTAIVTSAQFMSALDAGINTRVVVIVCVVAAITMGQFSLIPALEATRVDPLALIRGGGRSPKGLPMRDRASIIVLCQVIIATMLLVNTCALFDIYNRQRHARLGYATDHVIIASIAPRRSISGVGRRTDAYQASIAAVERTPGIEPVSAAIGAPLFKPQWFAELRVSGRQGDKGDHYSLQAVGPGYFATLGVPLLAGREFAATDRASAGSPNSDEDRFDVAIVNDALARRLWPGRSAIGQQLSLSAGPPATVVGIVGNLLDVSSVHEVPRAYFPLLESNFSEFELIARAKSDPGAAMRALEAGLRDVTVISRPTLRRLDGLVEEARTVSGAALAGFAISAILTVLLTASGLYGIVSIWTLRRQREIAIRMAVGAEASALYGLVGGDIAKLLVVGMALGGLCGLGLVQIERAFVGPYLAISSLPAVVAGLLLVVAAVVAVFVPMHRALRVPIARVLREA